MWRPAGAGNRPTAGSPPGTRPRPPRAATRPSLHAGLLRGTALLFNLCHGCPERPINRPRMIAPTGSACVHPSAQTSPATDLERQSDASAPILLSTTRPVSWRTEHSASGRSSALSTTVKHRELHPAQCPHCACLRDAEQARVVDLRQSPELQLTLRTKGLGLPATRAGGAAARKRQGAPLRQGSFGGGRGPDPGGVHPVAQNRSDSPATRKPSPGVRDADRRSGWPCAPLRLRSSR